MHFLFCSLTQHTKLASLHKTHRLWRWQFRNTCVLPFATSELPSGVQLLRFSFSLCCLAAAFKFACDKHAHPILFSYTTHRTS